MAVQIDAFREFVKQELKRQFGFLEDPYQQWQFNYVDFERCRADRQTFLDGLLHSAKFLFNDEQYSQLIAEFNP